MSNTNFPRFVVLLSLLGFSFILSAQTNKQVSILYNTKLVLAEVSPEGKILRIIDNNADDLKGYVLKTQDYASANNVDSKQIKSSKDLGNKYNYAGIDHSLVYFEKGGAILSDKAIETLESVIKRIKDDATLKLLVQTLDVNSASVLSKNRVSAIETYLKIRGVNKDLTVYEPLKGDTNLDEVKIQFIRK
jgi:hypothetical protein